LWSDEEEPLCEDCWSGLGQVSDKSTERKG
jgi:hypothetical protein